MTCSQPGALLNNVRDPNKDPSPVKIRWATTMSRKKLSDVHIIYYLMHEKLREPGLLELEEQNPGATEH